MVGDQRVRCLGGVSGERGGGLRAHSVPRGHPDVDVLDLDEAFGIDGGVIGCGGEGFYCLVGFEVLFADLELGGGSLEVQDWLADEEAAGGLLVVFGEGGEVFRSGSGGDGGERHVCDRDVLVKMEMSNASRSRINRRNFVANTKLRLSLADM